MADIVQVLGFEATQAIATLGRLKNALDQVNRSLSTFVQVSQALKVGTGPLNQAAIAAQNLANAATAAQSRLTALGASGAAAGNQVTLSWETVGRVLQTQVLVRGLSESIRLFQEAGVAASEFQIKIAQISNIASGPGSDIDSLSESVRKLSIELGRPLPEVSGAVYEALQNDLGTTAETFEILRTSANELARVTGGDLGQAVNALSSAIKSYNMTVEESTGLGDKFFAAIDKGRITLEELESSLGTILPLAREAGVSFDEALAAFTSITRSGTTASVAITQVRNILQKVIKPTEEAQKVLRELGFRSFPELIKQSGGLVPALTKVFNAIERDPEKLAKVFNTIRGNLGALNLLADDTKEFASVFDAIQNSAGRAAEGVARIDGTNARKAEKVFNELDVILTELGDSTLELTENLAGLFLGFIKDADKVKLLLTTFAVGIGSMGAVAISSSLGVNTLALSVARLKLALIGVAPAIAGIAAFFIAREIIQTAQGMDQAAVAAENLRRALVRTEQTEILSDATVRVQAFTRAFNESGKSVSAALDGVSTSFNKIIFSAEDANNRILESSQSIRSRFAAGAESILSAVDTSISDIAKRIEGSEKAASDGLRDLADFDFERGIKGVSAQAEATARLARADEQAQRARSARLTSSISAESQERAAIEEKYAIQLAKEAQLAAEKTKNRTFQERAENLVREALVGRIAGEQKAATALSKFNQQQARDRELLLIKEKTNLENLAAELEGLRNRFNNDGTPRTLEEVKVNESLALDVEKRLVEGVNRFKNNKVIKDLGLTGLATQVSSELQRGIETTKVRWNILADQLQAALSGRQFDATVNLAQQTSRPSSSPAVTEALSSDKRANPAEELSRQRDALLKIVELGRQNNAILEQGRVFLDSYNQGLQNVLAAANGFSINPVRGIGVLLGIIEDTPAGAARLTEKIKLLNTEINQAPTEKYGQLFAQINAISKELANTPLSSGSTEALNEALDQTALKLKTLIQQQELLTKPGSSDADAAAQRIKEIDASILALPPIDPKVSLKPFDDMDRKLTQSNTSAQKVSTQIGTNITGSAGTATRSVSGLERQTAAAGRAAVVAAQQYAAMARAAAAARQAGSAQNAYTGGKVTYRNAGGPLTRGMDSKLVAMQPGEMVINKRQSSNFFSQLQSINAGQSPAFRNTGGSVTNVGDINVSVKSEGSVSAKTGRDIAQSLRRELRRGTSSLG